MTTTEEALKKLKVGDPVWLEVHSTHGPGAYRLGKVSAITKTGMFDIEIFAPAPCTRRFSPNGRERGNRWRGMRIDTEPFDQRAKEVARLRKMQAACIAIGLIEGKRVRGEDSSPEKLAAEVERLRALLDDAAAKVAAIEEEPKQEERA